MNHAFFIKLCYVFSFALFMKFSMYVSFLVRIKKNRSKWRCFSRYQNKSWKREILRCNLSVFVWPKNDPELYIKRVNGLTDLHGLFNIADVVVAGDVHVIDPLAVERVLNISGDTSRWGAGHTRLLRVPVVKVPGARVVRSYLY